MFLNTDAWWCFPCSNLAHMSVNTRVPFLWMNTPQCLLPGTHSLAASPTMLKRFDLLWINTQFTFFIATKGAEAVLFGNSIRRTYISACRVMQQLCLHKGLPLRMFAFVPAPTHRAHTVLHSFKWTMTRWMTDKLDMVSPTSCADKTVELVTEQLDQIRARRQSWTRFTLVFFQSQHRSSPAYQFPCQQASTLPYN